MPKRVLQGAVVSDKMDKTVVVSIERRTTHRLYKKVITRSKKYHAHDEQNECSLGDIVRIEESRPYSKTKRWRVIEILTRGDVAEVSPEVIGRELETAVQRSPSELAEDLVDEDSVSADSDDSVSADSVDSVSADSPDESEDGKE